MLVKDNSGADQVVTSSVVVVVVEVELGEHGGVGGPVKRVVGGGLQLPGKSLVAELCRLFCIP